MDAILGRLAQGYLFFDGACGTMLQKAGLRVGEKPEMLNITQPQVLKNLHREYFAAGCDVVNTNTFGANSLKYSECGDFSLENIIIAAVHNAREAAEEYSGPKKRFVSLDIGPLGVMLEPLGEMPFERAVELFAEVVRIGAAAGVDSVSVETMNDLYETKAALLAVKENCSLPVFVSTTYDENVRLLTGAEPETVIPVLEGLGADAVGINCSLGSDVICSFVPRLVGCASVPVIVCPNAGLPHEDGDGECCYDITPEAFARDMASAAREGARVFGGCCGTTPEHMREMISSVNSVAVRELTKKNITVVTSGSCRVTADRPGIVIGERINPTGKPKLKQALRDSDIAYILQEGLGQEKCGAEILDVNVGLPGIDEKKALSDAVRGLQTVTALPLELDSSDFDALEAAMRIYNGKPMINSVNGKKESMERIFPLVKKYGGVVVALTLDESGIPDTAEGRVAVARKIYDTAARWGIDKKDIVVDALTLSVGTDANSANVTLEAVKMIHAMGGKTVLGVSNISFGMPAREVLNSGFFTLALENGLDFAIINPFSASMMQALYSFRALRGFDDNFSEYIAHAPAFVLTGTGSAAPGAASAAPGSASEAPGSASAAPGSASAAPGSPEPLSQAIESGNTLCAAELTASLLLSQAPGVIIDSCIIPALDNVGKNFEKNKVFLPQLLMSAQAAKAAFEIIRAHMLAKGTKQEIKGSIILATVKGDIHDIGKNIVKALLENYGYEVIDLGRDVPPGDILSVACEKNIRLVGLSALMTTTVPAMAETIALLKAELPGCRTVVGGAVLTEDYAEKIGADKYAADALATVRYADEVFSFRADI